MYQQQRVSIKSPHTTIEGRRVKKICIILDHSNVVHGILIMPEDIFDIKGILNFFSTMQKLHSIYCLTVVYFVKLWPFILEA